jgi:carboxyl-terminal processing protease
VREAVHKLTMQGVDRFVIDLRNNPGGYLDAMATAGSAFTPSTLGWKVRRNDIREPISSSEAPLSSARLVVLVNAGTASAAEALAAALHDIRKAVLVGSPTFGRGQIQTYVSLNDAEGVIVPAATIESPSGQRFNKRAGLHPDYTVISTRDEFDAALRKALYLLAS